MIFNNTLLLFLIVLFKLFHWLFILSFERSFKNVAYSLRTEVILRIFLTFSLSTSFMIQVQRSNNIASWWATICSFQVVIKHHQSAIMISILLFLYLMCRFQLICKTYMKISDSWTLRVCMFSSVTLECSELSLLRRKWSKILIKHWRILWYDLDL